jgi:hypothetical protein
MTLPADAEEISRDVVSRTGGDIEQRLGKLPQVMGGGKEASMPSDTAHGPGVFVMDFSAEDALPPGTGLCGGIRVGGSG